MSPTRGESILDQCLISSSLNDCYSDATVGPPLSTNRRGSHGQIFLSTSENTRSSFSRAYTVYDLRKSNIDRLLQQLQFSSFHAVYMAENINDKVNLFYDILNNCISQIPTRIVVINSSDKPWITPWLKHLINLCWEAYRSRNFNTYNHLKNIIKPAIINAKRNWYNRSSNSVNKMWNIVYDIKCKKSTSSIVSLLNNFNDYKSASNHINREFCKVFTTKSDFILPVDDNEWMSLVSIK